MVFENFMKIFPYLELEGNDQHEHEHKFLFELIELLN